MTRGKLLRAVTAALVALILSTSAVFADNVQNDVVAGGNDTFTAGGSTTINYRIASNNGDGQTGCNAADASPATVTINAPAGVTATPGSLSFTSCGTDKPVVFNSNTADDYEITVSVSDSGVGTYNTNPARFTLHVLAPADTTAPVITPNVSGTLGTNGWYTSDVSVTWSVVDNESAISSSTGCGSTTINADTSGMTVTCSATSAGGTSTESVTIKRDATNPTISGSASPAPNAAGWNSTNVAVSFTCSDNLSGVASCGPDETLSGDGAGQSVTGTAVDDAGNSASATVSGIDIDKTAPTISGSASPAANGAGWNNTNVVVSFTCDDNLSGVVACPIDQTLSSEGAGQSVTGNIADNAGNTASATVSNINIDKTAPSVSLVGGPANGVSYFFGSVPAGPTCSASDALSGLASVCSVGGYSAAVGTHTVTASATDNAGNTASAAATYHVLAWTLNGFYQPVDMAGIVNTVKGGSTVPLKFEVFAGSTELTDIAIISTLAKQVTCYATSEDTVEVLATGGTSLRYDWTGGQFVFNWQTPKLPGKCYSVTMTTADGSSLTALFKLK